MFTAIDLFAGFGGFSEAARLAGIPVLGAWNHCPITVAAHAANHPNTAHYCANLQTSDYSDVPEHNLMLASPSCQGMSQAGQPGRAANDDVRLRHDNYRATAWEVKRCAEKHRPEAMVVENVTDMEKWARFDEWLGELSSLGYNMQRHVLTASYMGVPQQRERVFYVGTQRDIGRLEIEQDDHETPFGPYVDQDHAHGWRKASDGSWAVQKRLRDAYERLGHEGEWLSQWVTGHKGVSLSEPIRTITTKAQWKYARVENGEVVYRTLTIPEHCHAMGFRPDYIPKGMSLKKAVKGLGNAVCPPVALRILEALKDAYVCKGVSLAA